MEGGADVWSKAGVIAEAFGSIGIVATLFYSVWSFRTTLRDAYYSELDREYFELLKIGLEKPYLVTFAASPDRAKEAEYGAYAFMVWNFVETIYDRCQGRFKQRLRDTWYPIIEAENALHRAWFDRPQNISKFKPSFVAFIQTKYALKAAAEQTSPTAP